MGSKLIDQMIDELQEAKCPNEHLFGKCPKQLVITCEVPSSDDLCSIPGAKVSNCDLLKCQNHS
jgi:hypothetical protein